MNHLRDSEIHKGRAIEEEYKMEIKILTETMLTLQ